MPSYRFCRPDDMNLLVQAVNTCFHPHFPVAPEYTVDEFKREVREDNLWSSSCMVALGKSKDDPLAVMIGAKRGHGTLIMRIAARPDSMLRGHCAHLLRSLSGKLAVLGPRDLYAELPAADTSVRRFFEKSAYREIGTFTDFVRPPLVEAPPHPPVEGITLDQLLSADALRPHNGCAWIRERESLINRKEDLKGFAVASPARIEGAVLFLERNTKVEVLYLGVTARKYQGPIAKSLIDALGEKEIALPRVAEEELPSELLRSLGFQKSGEWVRYHAVAEPV